MLPRYTWVLYLACPIQGRKEAGRLWEEPGREAPPHPTLCRPAHLHLSNLGSEERGGCASSRAAQGGPPATILGSYLMQTHLCHTAKRVLWPRCESSRSRCFLGQVGVPDTQPHLWKAQIRFISFLTPMYKPGAPKSVSKTLRN